MDTGAQDTALGTIRQLYALAARGHWSWDPRTHNMAAGIYADGQLIGTVHSNDDACAIAELHNTIPALLAALAAAETRQMALVALAHELVELEHGARRGQMQALNRLGIVLLLDEHWARARAFTEQQHARIDALAALGEGGA